MDTARKNGTWLWKRLLQESDHCEVDRKEGRSERGGAFNLAIAAV